MKNKKLAICTPCREGMFPINYVASSHSILKNPPKGWDVEYSMVRGTSDITNARNALLNMFYYNSDADAMMFMDSDVAMYPQDLGKMIAHLDKEGVDFIGGNYCKKKFDFPLMLQTASQWHKKEIQVQDVLCASADYVSSGEHIFYQEGELEGLCEVDGLGMGCFIITRDSAHKLFKWAEKNLEKTTFHTLGKEVKGYGVCNHITTDEGNFGEDYSLCIRIKEAGLRIFIDPSVKLTHTGQYDWEGDFLKYLEHKQALSKTEKKQDADNSTNNEIE